MKATDFLLPNAALARDTLALTSSVYQKAFHAADGSSGIALDKLLLPDSSDYANNAEMVWQQLMLLNNPLLKKLDSDLLTLVSLSSSLSKGNNDPSTPDLEALDDNDNDYHSDNSNNDNYNDIDNEYHSDNGNDNDFDNNSANGNDNDIEELENAVLNDNNEDDPKDIKELMSDGEDDLKDIKAMMSDGEDDLKDIKAMMSDGEDDLKDIKAMMSDEEDEQQGSDNKITKVPKSIVDDDFFSLHEMHRFAEKAEAWDEIQQARGQKDHHPSDSENELDSDNEETHHDFDLGLGFLSRDPDADARPSDEEDLDEDEDDDGVNEIMYEDFFGPREKVQRNPEPLQHNPRRNDEMEEMDEYYSSGKPLNANNTPIVKRSETSSTDPGRDEADPKQPETQPKQDTHESDPAPHSPTSQLFPASEDHPSQSTFEKLQSRLSSRISSLERDAVADKQWQLSGEALARARPVNSLLAESDLSVDYASKPVPVVTADTTASLEDVIRSRVVEALFDDVQRRTRRTAAAPRPARREMDEEKSSESLVQVYEAEYLKQKAAAEGGDGARGGGGEAEESREQKEVKALYASLCETLDALSNHHYTPAPAELASAEITVSAAPAISLEEVIPGYVSNAQLVAPGDVYRSGLKQSKSEMTDVDKKRAKRAAKSRNRKAELERKGKEAVANAESRAVGESKGQTSSAAVDELLGMENVTMISSGKDDSLSKGKKRKAGVLEKGGQIGASKMSGKSASFIKL